jgi:hypothetical protein
MAKVTYQTFVKICRELGLRERRLIDELWIEQLDAGGEWTQAKPTVGLAREVVKMFLYPSIHTPSRKLLEYLYRKDL